MQTVYEAADDEESSDEYPYIVDEVIQKHFYKTRNQYEFLVSWIGYIDTTWEIADNIPHEKIIV